MDNVHLSQDESSLGFNTDCGKTWIYPTNYPVREYQYNITNEALFKNTLVCLPTGLGKTFIAAVVMYNYYRWYPNGKIIFMAPSRPLVAQQIDACYNICAIPKETTVELTGSKVQVKRDSIWDEKRVFFITPQILENDLERLGQLGKQIKCLVFDEAHRARGNHAYCQIISKLQAVSKHFRVLALSASPGNTIVDVVNVCQSLLISHIEVRTEESLDVMQYVHKRTIEKIVIAMTGKMHEVHESYILVLDHCVRTLRKKHLVVGNTNQIQKGRFHFLIKEIEAKYSGNERSELLRDANRCMILYHAFELLMRHGLRVFSTFWEEHSEKPLFKSCKEIKEIMLDIKEYLGPTPNIDKLPDGTTPKIPMSTKFGHPKFYKLAEILIKHFEAAPSSGSKVIVFCEYRESVIEAYTCLLRHQPLIQPKMFVGQGTIPQKQQMLVVNSFKNGTCNTLISTCIGEEGLDIGEVDLVICFDISNKSTVRIVQRIGRTGRKRDGKVVMLVSEGKEQKILDECLQQRKTILHNLRASKELKENLVEWSPRMVPVNITPECLKMAIVVPQKEQPKKQVTNIKSFFDNMQMNASQLSAVSPLIQRDIIPTTQFLFNSTAANRDDDVTKLDFSRSVHHGLRNNLNGLVESSEDTLIFVHLLQMADSMRFHIPHTQNDTKSCKSNFKQGDIRTMFTKITSEQQQTQNSSSSSQPTTQFTNNPELNELHEELNAFITYSFSKRNDCTICTHLFQCNEISTKKTTAAATTKNSHWTQPNEQIIKQLITNENLDLYLLQTNESQFDDFLDDDSLDGIDFDDDFAQLGNNVQQQQTKEECKETIETIPPQEVCEVFNETNEVESNSPIIKLTNSETIDTQESNSPILSTYHVAKKIKAQKVLFTQEQAKTNATRTINCLSPDLFDDDSIVQHQQETKSQQQQRNADLRLDDVFSCNFLNEVTTTTTTTHHQTNEIEDEKSPILTYRKEKFNNKTNDDVGDDFFDESFLADIQVKKNEEKTNEPTKRFERNFDESLFDDSFLDVAVKTNELILDKQIDKTKIDNNEIKNQETIEFRANMGKENKELHRKTIENQTKIDDEIKEENKKKTIENNVTIRNLNNKTIAAPQKTKTIEMSDFFDDDIFADIDLDEIHSSNKRETETSQSNLDKENKSQNQQIFNTKQTNNCATPPTTLISHKTNDDFFDDSLLLETFATQSDAIKTSTQNANQSAIKKHFTLDDICELSVLDIIDQSHTTKQKRNGNLVKSKTSTILSPNLIKNDVLLANKASNMENEQNFSENEANLSVIKRNTPKKPNFSNLKLNAIKIKSQEWLTQTPTSTATKHTRNATKHTPNAKSTNCFENDSFFDISLLLDVQENMRETPKKSEIQVNLSDDDFEDISPPKSTLSTHSPIISKRIKRRKCARNEFVELEASVADDVSVSDDEFSQLSNHSSFLDDDDAHDDSIEKAHYLQSVRSPRKPTGRFKIPELPPILNRDEIFSQAVNYSTTCNTYLEDSFCVDSEQVSYLTQHDLSELEIAERRLKEERKQLKKRKSCDNNSNRNKRRRIIVVSDDDSD